MFDSDAASGATQRSSDGCRSDASGRDALNLENHATPDPEALDCWLPRDFENWSELDDLDRSARNIDHYAQPDTLDLLPADLPPGDELPADLIAAHLVPDSPRAPLHWSRWASIPAWDAAVTMRELSPAGMSVDAAVELAVMAQRVIAWATAVQYKALSRVTVEDPSDPHWYQDVVACALRIPSRVAQHRLALAKTMTSDLPDTLAALSAGAITPQHAEAIGEIAWTLPTPEHARRLEDVILPRATEQTVPELRRALRRAAIVTDPAIAKQRHARARATRNVCQRPV